MCNLSDAIELKGVQKGKAEGLEEGYDAQAQIIEKYMKKWNLSLEEALDISEISDTEKNAIRHRIHPAEAKEEAAKMCNLSDAIELRGIQKGREEGYDAQAMMVKQVMKMMNLSLEDALAQFELSDTEKQAILLRLQPAG